MSKATDKAVWGRCLDTPPHDWRNMKRFLWSLGAWAVCFAGGSQLIKRELLPAGPIPWVVALLPNVVAVLVIVAYARFLREADELQRVVQLQALALGFGGTFFALSGYRILERLGAPAADIGDFAVVMAVLYAVGSVLGWRRYR